METEEPFDYTSLNDKRPKYTTNAITWQNNPMHREVKIYRFKISNDDFYAYICDFAKLHSHESSETLKEMFESWCNEKHIKNYIEQEESMLNWYQYDLNKNSIKSKLFKSIKYYHIKNMRNQFTKTELKSRPKKVQFSKSFIKIVKNYLNENYKKEDFKPSTYFDKFCETQEYNLEKERLNLQEDEFITKFKKMFKNQYYNQFKK